MGERVREIKFRAWNGRELFNVDVLAISPCTWDCPDYGTRGVSLAYQPHIKVMQYTGMKDKNGKDIYEGDIVEERWPNPLKGGENVDRYKVEFYEKNGLYQMIHSSGETRWQRALFLRFKEVEVIGNIYENPELLEEGK